QTDRRVDEDHGLAGPGPAGEPEGAGALEIDVTPLIRMQEDVPGGEVPVFQDLCVLLVLVQNQEPAPRGAGANRLQDIVAVGRDIRGRPTGGLGPERVFDLLYRLPGGEFDQRVALPARRVVRDVEKF